MRFLIFILFLYTHLLASNIQFTPTEDKWLQEHPVITYVGDPSWLPYEGYNINNKYVGIVPDLLNIASKELPFSFKHVDAKTWAKSLEAIENDDAMIISQSNFSNIHTNHKLNFTQVYLSTPIVIVMQQGEKYVSSLLQIKEKEIGLLNNQSTTPEFKERYPSIDFVLFKDVDTGLTAVATGEVPVFLCSLPRAGYAIATKQLTNLRIVGKTKLSTELGFGINPNYPELLGIMNKLITSTPELEVQSVLSKWSRQKYVEKIDHTALYIALSIFVFIALITLAFVIKIRRETHARLQAQTKMLEQQSKMAAMGEMLDAVAHQWKQPLNALSMYSELLHSDFDDGSVDKAYIDEMHEGVNVQIDHMTSTLSEFRDFFRPNQGTTTFNLQDIVNTVLFLVKDEFLKNGITVTLEVDSKITLKGNENEFKHLIINIINNAKDAFNEKALKNRQITISAIQENDTVTLEILDNAGGIPSKVLPHIFEANVTTKEKGQGTGIGLYMSAQIVKKMDGELSVANKEEGACFTIVFEHLPEDNTI